MAKYVNLKGGEPVTLEYTQSLKTKGAAMNFCCCDCNLVHTMAFVPLKTRIKVYFWRDSRRTAARRRKQKRHE